MKKKCSSSSHFTFNLICELLVFWLSNTAETSAGITFRMGCSRSVGTHHSANRRVNCLARIPSKKKDPSSITPTMACRFSHQKDSGTKNAGTEL